MKKTHIMGAALFFIPFFVFLTYIKWNTNEEKLFLGSREVNIEKSDWKLIRENQENAVTQLPVRLNGKKEEFFSVTKQISFLLNEEQYMCFRSTQNQVWVYVDGALAYTYGVQGTYALSKAPGSAWNVIKLPGGESSYTIQIILKSPYDYYSGLLPEVFTGTKTGIYTYILEEHIPFLFTGLVYILVTLFILGSRFILKKVRLESSFYLTMLVMQVGLWFITDSSLTQFVLTDAYWFSQFECLLVLSFPTVLLAYMRTLKEFRKDRLIRGLFYLSFAGCLLTVLLEFLRVKDLIEMIPFAVVIYAAVLVIIVCSCIQRWSREGRGSLRWRDAGLALMLITGIHDIYGTCCLADGESRHWFPYGVFFFVLVIAVSYEKELALLYVEKLEDERFKVLAYKDALTGLENRTAFEEKLDEFRTGNKRGESVYIVIMDINNLKHINDTYGHKTGDKAIMQVASLAESSLSKYGDVYRIGGDEFCIIIHKIEQSKVDYILDKLSHNISGTPFIPHIHLSVAIGYDVYTESQTETIDEIFIQADRKMYQCKQTMKSGGKKRVDSF